MKKQIISLLIVLALCVGFLPLATAEAASGTAKIVRESLSLSGILGVNFHVEKNGETSLSGYTLEASVAGRQVQTVSTYTEKSGLYIFTAGLSIKDVYKPVNVSLKKNGTVVQEGTFLFTDYMAALKAQYPTDTQLHGLLDALADYGTYAAYYADPSGSLTDSAAVEGVTPAALAQYAHRFTATQEGKHLNPTAALYLDSACDLQVKFDAFDGCVLTVDGVEIPQSELTVTDNCWMWSAKELLPQDWNHAYRIVVTRDGAVLAEITYSVLSYVYAQISRKQEAQSSLTGLLKAMYLYHTKAHYEVAMGTRFVGSQAKATAGSTDVPVDIIIRNNPGLLGLQMSVEYDESVLTLTDAVSGSALEDLTYQEPSRYISGCNFLWYGTRVDRITDGTVLSLSFSVAENAPAGVYPITIVFDRDNTYDANFGNVTATTVNGVVVVE